MMTLHPTIEFKRVNPDAQIPTKAHPSDAAYDLCAMEDVTLRPGEWKMVGSGIACAIPEGFCGMVYPRSGMGCKGLVFKNTVGVIDSHVWKDRPSPDSNTTITELVPNTKGTIRVRKGDRVAQMRIELVPDTTLVEVEELDATDRGEGGFGSSGVRGERL